MRKPRILTLEQIKKTIIPSQVIKGQEEGFVFYSKGVADIPPFGSLHFENPPGTVHLKYGAIKGDHHLYLFRTGGYASF